MLADINKKQHKKLKSLCLTSWKKRDIIIKLSDESKRGAKSSEKIFQKRLKKGLTNEPICDIINLAVTTR